MDNNRLQYLFQQYEADTLSDQEKKELFEWIDDQENTEQLLAFFETTIRATDPQQQDAAKWKTTIASITGKRSRTIPIFRWVAAASVVLMLSVAGWLVLNKEHTPAIVQKTKQATPADLPPGHDGAILTLSNGQQIVLDSVQNGTLANEGNAEVIKEKGQLSYKSKGAAATLVYNTVTTPKGRQYHLVLTDGTKVWLNAASSITYPALFDATTRTVTITGEAYFEVAHNNTPFIVKKGNTEVQVLGTGFNINAYDDEPDLKVTLLHGKVKVNTVLLKPGEQASVAQTIHVQAVNTDIAVAWKNGIFSLKDADIPSIMRQIARWYDVDVIYQGTVPNRHFGGTISRNISLQNLVQALELSKVHCKLEGRKLIVLP